MQCLLKGKKRLSARQEILSHKSTAECFEIEDDIISRVMQNVYVKTCDVYARDQWLTDWRYMQMLPVTGARSKS